VVLCTEGGGSGDDFEAMLRWLQSAPKNNDVGAEVILFDFSGEDETIASRRERLDLVVEGCDSIFVVIEPGWTSPRWAFGSGETSVPDACAGHRPEHLTGLNRHFAPTARYPWHPDARLCAASHHTGRSR
jgi:hypothetical protein